MDSVEPDETIAPSPASDESQNLAGDETIRQPSDWPKIPGYEVVGLLGRGAMGVVYEAVQTNLSRHVALKVLTAVDDPEQRERFQSEAEAAARLRHPNIVQVYDIGEHAGKAYISLEYVGGGTLESRLTGERLPPREAAEIVATLARAIDQAHRAGIVHRDLKPANIMRDANGVLKITDFGLAKRMEADSSQTRAGDILGTPYYMSPEQAFGKLDSVGPASDIYGLGVVLYELLTGRLPSKGESVIDTLEKVRHQDPAPPRKLVPSLHRDIETICLKCLQKTPRHRYESAAALADDLQSFLNGHTVHARPVGTSEKLTRWVKRRPAVTALIAALVLLLPTVGVLLTRVTSSEEQTKALESQTERLESQAETLQMHQVYELTTPVGLPPVLVPSDNQLTLAKVNLGRQLFFDPRLSADNTISCASCHDPNQGWSDGLPTSMGIGGQFITRNSPSIVNASYYRHLFWDGRAMSMEAQAPQPITNPREMGMPSFAAVATKINRIPGYRERFQRIFGNDATGETIGKAIAAFERTILAGDTPYDRFLAGDKSALSPEALRGMKLFFGRASCTACHSGPMFSDDAFHNIGVGTQADPADSGRLTVSTLEGDTGSFKTPTLRDLTRTAPYMHDGSMATLEDVIAHYNRGGDGNPYQDEEIFPLQLSEAEQQDLLAFLTIGLTSAQYPIVEVPMLP